MQEKSVPHSVGEFYDTSVNCIIPYYQLIHAETLNLIRATVIKPRLWIDTGCGTGTLVEAAAKLFPNTTFVLTDPSPEMMREAKRKLDCYRTGHIRHLELCRTHEIILEPGESADLVTAIMCHHYLDQDTRKRATHKCYELLRECGFNTVELLWHAYMQAGFYCIK